MNDPIRAALTALVGPMEGPDGTGDEEQWWWNHSEWPDDEQLLGGTVGDYRKARAALASAAGRVGALPLASAEVNGLDVERLADDVRYGGNTKASRYWEGFNDGVDALAAAYGAEAKP